MGCRTTERGQPEEAKLPRERVGAGFVLDLGRLTELWRDELMWRLASGFRER